MAHDHRMNEVGEPHLNKVNRMRNEQSFANSPTRQPVKTVMYDDGIHGYEEYEDGSIVDLPRSMRS